MPRIGRPAIDLTRPRGVFEIVSAAVRLYAGYPGMFISLAALILLPYMLIVVAIGHAKALLGESSSLDTLVLLQLIYWVLLLPLISALQMQAIVATTESARPRLWRVIRGALPAVPVVVAAQIMAGIGIVVGLMVFVIPGIYMAVRLAVVAPTAAFERQDWMSTLRTAWRMTRGNAWRVLGLLLVVGIVIEVLGDVLISLSSGATLGVQVAIAIVITVLLQTLQTLATALLYFDLRSRE
jgi:membrane-anchored glycerophosphoryl diester phosphodiesterase (GDPDase)